MDYELNSNVLTGSNKNNKDAKEEFRRKEKAKTRFAMLYKELEDVKIEEKREEQIIKREIEDKEIYKKRTNGVLSEKIFLELDD